MMTPQEVLKTYQCVDDPIAALLDVTEIAFIQADARAELLTRIAELEAQLAEQEGLVREACGLIVRVADHTSECHGPDGRLCSLHDWLERTAPKEPT